MESKKGVVYIIGAGPGDPGLITVKGAACLCRADVIVYDYLAGSDLLGLVKKDARLIYVGKKGGDHTLPQDEINRLLVAEASKGSRVARLKGGDPFIFGRGGEEAEALAAKGIPYEVVPGVTSAVSVPAYAGIPLTHRGLTSTVAFVAGHEDPGKDASDVNWRSLAGIGTLVFLMGVKNLSKIVANLLENGKDAATPAALIQWGTTPDQVTVIGTLGNIGEKADERKIAPPAVLVVGSVVGLRGGLDWFETKPLFGKGIVITRPEEQSRAFGELLSVEGARPIFFPTIKIEGPKSTEGLDRALEHIEGYDWIIFTSANGVNAFFRRLHEGGGDIRNLKGIAICAIGPATAALLRSMGIRADLVPDRYISEGVLEALNRKNLQGKKILLPRAEMARDVLPDGLVNMGASVDVVVAYRTVNSERTAQNSKS